jgi:TRAP-type C4-dicarboxylate transport system substrate-binding protein
MAINKGRFDRLPPEVQKAFREAGDAWSALLEADRAAVTALMQKMVDGGAKVSR